MKRIISTIRLTAAVLACTLACISTSSAGKPKAMYSITPFLPPGSVSLSSAVSDINERGQAVGYNEVALGVHEAIHLDLVTGDYTILRGGTYAIGVNNLSQIVGRGGMTGLFWASPLADPVELPPLEDDLSSDALRINDDGIIVAQSWNGKSGIAVAWRVYPDANRNLQVDGPVAFPLVFFDDKATDVNEVKNGVSQVLVDTGIEPIIWTIGLNPDGTLSTPDSPVPVATLGLQDPSWSSGNGINNSVDVCGFSDSLPFVAWAGQEPQVLSIPRGALYATALDINDGGQVVGYAAEKFKGFNSYPGVNYAYLWQDGERISLTAAIPPKDGWDRLSRANVISNDGLIGGSGRFDVEQRGFVLIPN